MIVHAHVVPSFVGGFGVAVDEGGRLVRTHFLEEREPDAFRELLGDEGFDARWDADACRDVRAELEEYFRGERRRFSLPIDDLDRLNGTPFQRRVWTELARIPFGETISYGELARRVGPEGGSRAVGRANHVNPLPIVLPCHRVIGQDGSLTGFGGGLDAKRKLIDFERGQRSLF